MNQLSVMSETKTMTSREIANVTGKEHANVLRDIRAMLDLLKIDAISFEGIYLDAYSREKTMFELSKDLTITLVSGYSAPLRYSIIKRWEELEKNMIEPVFKMPKTIMEHLLFEVEQQKIIEGQALQITLAQPAVNFVEQYTDTTKTHCLSDVAKLLKYRPQEFMAMMNTDRIIFKRNGSWIASQKHIDAGRFSLKTGKNNGNSFVQTRVEPLGITWLAEKYGNYLDYDE